jgi:electron transfer flavoprotein alpha subunit
VTGIYPRLARALHFGAIDTPSGGCSSLIYSCHKITIHHSSAMFVSVVSSLSRTFSSVVTRTAAVVGTSPSQPRWVTLSPRLSLRWATTLVLAEGSSISSVTCQAVTAATQLKNDQITLLVVSGSTSNAAPSQVPAGTTKLLHAALSQAVVVPESAASAVYAAVQADPNITHVVSTSSKFGSTVLPRAAALLSSSGGGCSPIHDVIQIISRDTFIRPLYAGNVLIKVQMTDALKVLSIRPTAFDKAALVDASTITTESLTTVVPFTGSEFVSASAMGQQDRPELSAADIVVSGGRGLGHKDKFVLLEQLADALGGAAIGASRAAVDAGMAPNDQQVGQTGKVVAPNLYIAIGISGAIQHLSGMRDSKTIVAINKDAEAPIFQVADYGLVADLFEAVPELTSKLQKLKAP